MSYCRRMPRPSAGPRRTPPSTRLQRQPARPSLQPSPDPQPGRAFLTASYTLGVFLGVGLGLYGVFLVPAGPRPGGMLLSLGVLVALVGNGGAALLVRWLTGTRLGPTTVLIGWAVVVLLFASSRPEGDLLLRASGFGYAFLLLEALSPIAVIVLAGARRGLAVLPPGR